MNMTFSEAHSKIFSILETAIYNYEIEVITEASDDGAKEQKESKFGNIAKSVVSALKWVWANILKAIDWIIMKVAGWRQPVQITKDITVHKGALSFDSKLMRFATEFSNFNFSNYDNASEYFNSVSRDVELKAGKIIMVKDIKNAMDKYKAAVEKLKNVNISSSNNPEMISRFNTAIKITSRLLGEYVSDAIIIVNMHKEIDDANLAEKIGKAREKLQAKKDKKENKGKEDNVKNESTDLNSLRDTLLTEAIRLMTEDASNYVDGMAGGGNLYDGSQLEDPEASKKYNTDASGGAGVMDEEDIKKLVGDDAEALEVLRNLNDTNSVIISF